MKHIHIALVLFVCSFITLSCAKSTLVYRRYHRKHPSLRKTQKNVVEIVEVFKTNRKPPAFMKSDKSIEKFLLCDSKCEKKRFIKRRKMCLRTGRFCPTRPSGSKVHPTTQINVSTRPIYNKPTIYNTNPYNNRNPDYTHLYPWSRPSVTVTKYPPDGSKDFNMTIVEVNNDTVITPIKDDYEYYDTDNDDRYQQRRSTTFRVPTTTSEWTIPEISTIKDMKILAETSSSLPPATLTDTTTAESIRSTITTTSEASSPATEFPIIITNQPEPEDLSEPTTEYWRPAPPTPIYIEPSTTPTTTEIPTTRRLLPSTTEEITTEASTSSTSTTEIPTSTTTTTQATTSTTTTTQASTSTSTTTQATTSTTESSTSTSTTTQATTSTTTPASTSTSTTTQATTSTSSTTQATTSTSSTTQASTTSSTTEVAATPFTESPTTVYLTSTSIPITQNQTDATNTEVEEEEEDGGETYDYEEGEGEEGTEELGEEDNTQVDADGDNGNAYDYDDDGNYDDEDP